MRRAPRWKGATDANKAQALLQLLVADGEAMSWSNVGGSYLANDVTVCL